MRCRGIRDGENRIHCPVAKVTQKSMVVSFLFAGFGFIGIWGFACCDRLLVVW